MVNPRTCIFFALAVVPLHAWANLSQSGAPKSIDPASAVSLAFKNRKSLASARQRVEEAQKLKTAAGAYPLARVEIANGTRPDVSGGEDLSFFQPIDTFGKYKASRSAGEAALLAAQALLQQTSLDVQSDVLTAFANALAASRLLAASEIQLEIAKTLQVSTEKRVQAQSLPELQLTRAGIELQRAQQVMLDRKAGFESAKVRLASAMGVNPDPNWDFSSSQPVPDPFVDVSQGLAQRRPDLLTLAADVEAAKADTRIQKLGLLPDFELQVRRSPWASDDNQYGARLQMVLPLWDYGANRSKRNAATLHVKVTEALFEDRLRQATQEVAAGMIDLAAARKSATMFGELANSAKQLLDKTQRGFELGATSLIDVLDARRALSDAQELTVNAQLRLDLARVTVYQAQGMLLKDH